MGTKLYCTQCGKEMGKQAICPDPNCHAESDYWNVVAPHLSQDYAEEGESDSNGEFGRSAGRAGPLIAGAAGRAGSSRVAQADNPSTEGLEEHNPEEEHPTHTVPLSGREENEGEWHTLDLRQGRCRPTPVAELVRLTHPGENQVFPLFPGENQIGTRGEHEILLDDPTISNPHALIACQLQDGAYKHRIIDLKSRNGTFVDGRSISRSDLPSTCIIRLADIEFRFRLHEDRNPKQEST